MNTDNRKKLDLLFEDLTYKIIGAAMDIKYKNAVFKRRLRADLLVEEKVLVENKAITTLTASDEAQLFNYLKTTGMRVGLLFNFGSPKLQRVRRIV